MEFIKEIKNIFLKQERNEVAKSVKKIFSIVDPKNKTKFPYNFSEDFFQPLSEHERKYIIEEILKWYNIYIEETKEKYIKEIGIYSSLEKHNIEEISIFKKQFPEEYNMLIQSTLETELPTFLKKYINGLEDIQLLNWKPVEKKDIWEPKQSEIKLIVLTLGNSAIFKLKEEIKNIDFQIKQIDENKEVILIINEDLKEFLNNNKSKIIRNAYYRFNLEYNSFPKYYGMMDKQISNKIFNKYLEAFEISSFNDLMKKAYFDAKLFKDSKREDEFNQKFINSWNDYLDFILNEYASISSDEFKKELKQEFNINSASIDYFIIFLFNIYMED